MKYFDDLLNLANQAPNPYQTPDKTNSRDNYTERGKRLLATFAIYTNVLFHGLNNIALATARTSERSERIGIYVDINKIREETERDLQEVTSRLGRSIR